MLWIMGLASLTAILVPILGWNWKHRRALALWCGVLTGMMVLLLPVGLFVVGISLGFVGTRAEDLNSVSVLTFGPASFAVALGLSSVLLLRDWRWRVGILGALAVLAVLGWLAFSGWLHSANI